VSTKKRLVLSWGAMEIMVAMEMSRESCGRLGEVLTLMSLS